VRCVKTGDAWVAAHIRAMDNDTAPDAESAISHYRTAERILVTLPPSVEVSATAAQAHATLALAALARVPKR